MGEHVVGAGVLHLHDIAAYVGLGQVRIGLAGALAGPPQTTEQTGRVVDLHDLERAATRGAGVVRPQTHAPETRIDDRLGLGAVEVQRQHVRILDQFVRPHVQAVGRGDEPAVVRQRWWRRTRLGCR